MKNPVTGCLTFLKGPQKNRGWVLDESQFFFFGEIFFLRFHPSRGPNGYFTVTNRLSPAGTPGPPTKNKIFEKSFPARLVVRLEFRKPVAMVEVKQGLYPVDARGLLLPPKGFSASDARRFPLIRGILSTPHGPAGTPWGDVALVGGAGLADILAPYWQDLGLQAIVVPKLQQADADFEELVYELLTPHGTRIIWGRAPGSAHPGELATEQKVGRLQEYRTDFGGFDQPHGPYEIDIRHWREMTRRPLASHRGQDRL